MSRRWRLLVAGALAGWVAAASPARAHSLLLESSPAPNATLTAAPPRIDLRFNNRIEVSLSRIRLVDARGVTVTLPPASGAGADRLAAAVPALGPGRWRVEWQVLSTDGHVVAGSYEFRVAP